MSDNPQAPAALEFALPSHRVLAITGRDATAFAHAQFMNDVKALPAGQWQWNGWLTAKGRVIALFALIKLDAETLWLLLPDAEPQALAQQLQRYVFRSKVALQPLGMHACGRFLPPATASGPGFANVDAGEVELDMGGAGGPRSLYLRQAPAAGDADSARRWLAADIAHGLPRLRDSQVEAWTPQQLSLERLRAFSVKKGCYPGQEIVTRTHYLGQAKRGLARLQGAGVAASAEVLEAGAAPATARVLGQLVCAEGGEGLAVMPLDAGDGPFACGGQPCARLPLLDGLAR